MKNKDAISPTPKPGDVLAVYKPPFSAWGITDPEERKGLTLVERVTSGGQITLAGIFGGRRFDKSGAEVGRKDGKLHVRWPTVEDRADHRRQFITNALLRHPWGRETEETCEEVARLLGIEVKDP